MKYDIDEDTKDLLGEIMTWAQAMIDLQVDDEVRDEMQDVMTDLADIMGITYKEIHVQESVNDKGQTVVQVVLSDDEVEEPAPKKSHLTLVSNAEE
tara:strand:- start:15036 stop:15323 length:288 start_codon:yes stop_codon:yes gene_type:complete